MGRKAGLPSTIATVFLFTGYTLRFMTAPWNIAGLLRDLAARGQHPAVIAFGEDGSVTWDSTTVADEALRLAGGLRGAGVGGAAGWRCGPPTPRSGSSRPLPS